MANLSIIVPVYNNKDYLEECIVSIIRQKYDDIEILLIDDGSTDGSGEICDIYQGIDKRIRVIHQENRGCVFTRQRGLKVSKGSYIGFVDSDDWIAEDMYERLMAVAEQEKCDIVSMGYTIVAGEVRKEEHDGTLLGIYEKDKNLDILLSNMMYDMERKKRGVQPSLCSKVFRREILEKEFAKIDERITMGEDAAIFYPCCLKAEKIFIMQEYKYFYRVHNKSMCRSINADIFTKIYIFYQYMEKIVSEYKGKYGLLKQLKKYIWNFLGSGIEQVFDIYVGRAFVFPYHMVEQKSNIVLYGAGEVGQIYYEQIVENQYCNIVAWADKYRCSKKRFISPGEILNFDYSKIVIAIEKREVAQEIKKELMMLGINEERIVWSKPQQIEASVL